MTWSGDDVKRPKIYLAHATEDKGVVRPLAKEFMTNGIDVWFDEWEIRPGDSLRQKMEEGLLEMTHFVVILTPTSLLKPWVAVEMDAGIIKKIDGKGAFVPLLVGVEHTQLPLILRTMFCPKFDPLDPGQVKTFVDFLHGVSKKPALGPLPKYMETSFKEPNLWSKGAIEICRQFILSSKNAMRNDPIKTKEQLIKDTGLSEEDVRISILELKDAGYLLESNVDGYFAPECAMFTEFDEKFKNFNPKNDAIVVANRMIEGNSDVFNTEFLAIELGWEPRRMNSAICCLLRAGAIKERYALASAPWRAVQLVRDDKTRRFVYNCARGTP